MTHLELAILWSKYIGQKGTTKQVERIMKQLSVESLIKILKERNQI